MMRVSTRMPAFRRAMAAALLIGVVAGVMALLFMINGPVQVVRVMGDLTGAERDAVQAAVARKLDGGLLGMNLDLVVDNVLALSWPREVSVRRLWPAIVEVNVTKDSIAAR